LRKNPTNILTEEIDEELLSRMPEWFQVLRKEYRRKLEASQTHSDFD